MGTTTRRVTDEELERIKSIKSLLDSKGIKISQTELTAFMTEYVIENYDDFVDQIIKYQKGRSEDRDKLKEFLLTSYAGEESDVVKEHDVIV